MEQDYDIHELLMKELEPFHKRFEITYMYLLLGTLVAYSCLAWRVLDTYPFCFFMGFLFFLNIGMLVLCYLRPFHQIRVLLLLFVCLFILAACPLMMLSHVLGGYGIYCLILVQPVYICVLYPHIPKHILLVICGSTFFFIIAFLFFSELMTEYIRSLAEAYLSSYDLTTWNRRLAVLLPIPVSAAMLFYALCAWAEERELQMAFLERQGVSVQIPEKENLSENKVVKGAVETEKYEELYEQILLYFEKDKPYLQPNFSIAQLSLRLSSNVTYIAKAIKAHNDGVNFTLFINKYRIENVKKLMRQSHGRYSLEYIYTASGFSTQSTFNKVFLQIVGMTPTDYQANNCSEEINTDNKPV
jgi:AraC-like DNA-binding protein